MHPSTEKPREEVQPQLVFHTRQKLEDLTSSTLNITNTQLSRVFPKILQNSPSQQWTDKDALIWISKQRLEPRGCRDF